MLGIVVRFLAALVLVFATWNPTGRSFYHWLMGNLSNVTALLVFAGVVLVIGWFLFLHATLEPLGLLGIILTLAFFGSLTWLVFDLGWLSTNQRGAELRGTGGHRGDPRSWHVLGEHLAPTLWAGRDGGGSPSRLRANVKTVLSQF